MLSSHSTIALLDLPQVAPQNELSAHGVHKAHLKAGEADVGGYQINALRVFQDTMRSLQ